MADHNEPIKDGGEQRILFKKPLPIFITMLILALTAGPCWNMNAVQDLWRGSGMLACPEGIHTGDKICKEALEIESNALKAFQSGDMYGGVVAWALMKTSPFTALVLAEFVFAASSIFMMAQSTLYPAMLIQGLTTQAILTPALFIGSIYSDQPTFMSAILGATVECSQLVYPLFEMGSHYFSWMDYYFAQKFLVAMALVCVFLVLTMFPKVESSGTCTPLPRGSQRVSARTRIFSQRSGGSELGVKGVGALDGFFDFRFLVFSLVWIMWVLRGALYLDGNRDILAAMGDDGTYATIFSWCLPFAMIPGLGLGYAAESVGTLPVLVGLVSSHALSEVLSLIPILQLQLLSFALQICSKAVAYTLLFTYCLETFGTESNITALIAVPPVIAGLINQFGISSMSQAMKVSGDWTVFLKISSMIGAISTFTLIALWLFSAPPAELPLVDIERNDEKGELLRVKSD